MRILYITTIGDTMGFFRSFIEKLLAEGHKVDIATNENNGVTAVRQCFKDWGCRVFHISCSRVPFKAGNMRAVKEIGDIVVDGEYDIVHCHTPIAAACTRIACRPLRKKQKLKVVYTAHGFHFYDGAPLKNWIVYYPVEKWLSRYTDVLITINREDYKRASEKFSAKKTVYIPGVGIDTKKFAPRASGRIRIREELGLADDQLMLLSVGELNENKNHEAVIRAIQGMDLTYVIVGKGDLKEKLETIADDCGVDLRLMGFRNDVAEFYNAADVYILPSIREGLNVSLMEAMSSGLACCCGDIRGNRDLVEDKACLFEPSDGRQIKEAILYTIENRKKLCTMNQDRIRQFDLSTVNRSMYQLYKESESLS